MSHKRKKIINQEVENVRKPKTKWLFVLLAILFLTNLISLFFYIKERPLINLNDAYTFLNPARKIFAQEDLIVNVQPLRDYLSNKYQKDPNVSIYFEYLPTGASIAVNKESQFYPASLLKIPVAMAVANKVESGAWQWDNKLVLMASDKDDKFGDLYKETTGSTFTIDELVKRSLVDSDNTAHFILVRNLEIPEINDVYTHMGLDGFLKTDGSISAKNYSVILRSLYNSTYLDDVDSQKIISYLSEEKFMDYLGSGIPDNVKFAHKIGTDTEKKIYLDSGIVYLKNRPYILIVMTQLKTEQEAKDIMKDVSGKVFEYINSYKG